MNHNRHTTKEETTLSHLKPETYVQKVSFPFSNSKSTLMFKFIADIDEASPSEDEEAARRALHHDGAEGGDLHPDGSSFISTLDKKSILMFKFIADIDEASPSEDEAAAQRALHGAEGGDLHPDG